MSYTTIMKRNARLGDMVRVDETYSRALQRAQSLEDLHNGRYEYDEATKTFTVDATKYYEEGK